MLNEWATYNEDETPLTHVRYGLISRRDLSFKVADKKYKDNVKFSVALQQHHLFNKEAVKNDPKQFSMRYKQKGVQPFFPLTKTAFTYCTSDSSTAEFNNVQSVGMIMSRQMVCRPTTIVFPESMIVQQTYSHGLGTGLNGLGLNTYPAYPANMYVILTVISLTNGDREVTKDILLRPQVSVVLGVSVHPGYVANSLTFSPILKEGNDSNTPCTRISKEQNQITVNLGGNK